MDGHEIVDKMRGRKKWSGSVGALFLLSHDADNLLAYIEWLENWVAANSGNTSSGDTDTQAPSQ